MKLEKQFFRFFFILFSLGLILSALIIITISLFFTGDYLDKKTGNNLVELIKDHSKININSINDLISTLLLKMQLSLSELIHYYQKLSNQLKKNDKNLIRVINDEFLISTLDINETYNENNPKTAYMAYWLLDNETNLSNLKENSIEKNQLITISNMMKNIFATYYSSNVSSKNYYFYFESTELFISFPLLYDLQNGFISEILNFEDNGVWCTDKNGEKITYYKTKCRGFYNNIIKSKSDIFDINYKDNENRTIFVTDFYSQLSIVYEIIFTLCIEFNDPFSNKSAYICADVNSDDLNYNLNNINSKLSGYFFINPVGFSHSFYFPGNSLEALTNTENIFRKDITFFLEEKIYFLNNIQKLMSSNYIKQIKNNSINSLDLEVFTNGENDNEQIFYLNNEKFRFAMFPIILENCNQTKEHVLNIIFIYNNKLIYDEIKFDSDIEYKIIIEIIIFFIVISSLLYLIILSFNFLAKYIVIPIKNINYMLRGINIGGKNRLQYLNFLQRKQNENIEILDKKNEHENKKYKNDNESDDDLQEENKQIGGFDDIQNKKNEIFEDSPLIENYENNQEQNDEKISDDEEYNDEMNNSKNDYYNKFNNENEFFENESNFFHFNEELLQYRPLEIENLVQALIELKDSLILTSSDQQVDVIINYSNSGQIFKKYKNNEGNTICESNIGNLQSQLLKYDKAIFHLVNSLEDNKLKKFLYRTLNDEYDNNNTLLNLIYHSFMPNKSKGKKNSLIEKQQNNTKNNFSQKYIGVFINSRYNKLIHVYYKFFSLVQKFNFKAVDGLFMNTFYHNINYYHKVIIQYIYLCYVKNDLIKIGESILDYIEFLIKFKLKTSNENKYILNIRSKNIPNWKQKLNEKKIIFNKIMNWFNLFDEYVNHVRKNTSIDDSKSLINDFSLLSSDNIEFNIENHSLFLFKINIQRSEFLKGKFALLCNNNTDALFFFIRAAKKKSIISDGLIKKKCLKRISKILSNLFQRFNHYDIITWPMKAKIQNYEKIKSRYFNKKLSINIEKEESIKGNSFKKEMLIIKDDIMSDIEECNIKQTKDLIIIIDFNIYNQDIKNDNNGEKINLFIDQTKIIIDDYLSNNDRLAVFIYKNQYQMVCPLMTKSKIDLNNFSKDLMYYQNNIFNITKDDEESNTYDEPEIGLENQILSNSDSQKSFQTNSKEYSNDENNIIKGLINTVTFSQYYLKFKQNIKNEKFIILFTDFFNTYKINDKVISSNIENLNGDKELTFLLVGINREKYIINNKDKNYYSCPERNMSDKFLCKFSEKSEVIYFENMKKIKNIISSNNIIKDEIIFPNEIFK